MGINGEYLMNQLDALIADEKDGKVKAGLEYLHGRINQSYRDVDVTQDDIQDILTDPRAKDINSDNLDAVVSNLFESKNMGLDKIKKFAEENGIEIRVEGDTVYTKEYSDFSKLSEYAHSEGLSDISFIQENDNDMELDRIPSLDEFENQETNESIVGTTATVTDKDGKGEYIVTLDKEGKDGIWDATIKEITKNEHDYNNGDVLKVKAGNTHGTYWGMITESVDSLLKSIEAQDGKVETEEVEAIFKGKKEKNLHVYTDKVRNPNPWGLETVSSNGRRGYIIPLDESDLEPEVMELMEGIDMEQDRAKWNAALQVYNKIGHDKITDKQAVSNAIKGIKLDIDPQVVLDTFKGVNTSLSKKDPKTLEKAKKSLGRGNSDTEKLMLAMIDNMSEMNEGIELHHYKDRLPGTPKTDALPFDKLEDAIKKAEEISKTGEYAEIFQDGKLMGHAYRGSKFFKKTDEALKDKEAFRKVYTDAIKDVFELDPKDKDQYGNYVETHIDAVVNWVDSGKDVDLSFAEDAWLEFERMTKTGADRKDAKALVNSAKGLIGEEEQIDESSLNLPKEGDMNTKRGKTIVKSLDIGDTDRAFDIMSKIADTGKDDEWADAKKVYQGFNDELIKSYKSYNEKVGNDEFHIAYESSLNEEYWVPEKDMKLLRDDVVDSIKTHQLKKADGATAKKLEKAEKGGEPMAKLSIGNQYFANDVIWITTKEGDRYYTNDSDLKSLDESNESLDTSMWTGTADAQKKKADAYSKAGLTQAQADFIEKVTHGGDSGVSFKEKMNFLATITDDDKSEIDWNIKSWDRNMIKANNDMVKTIKNGAKRANENNENDTDMNESIKDLGAIKKSIKDTFGIGDDQKSIHKGDLSTMYPDATEEEINGAVELLKGDGWAIEESSEEGGEGEGAENTNEEVYTMSDGFNWNMLSKQDAMKAWKKGEEVFGIDKGNETEHLIETEADFNDWDYFGQEGVNEAYEGSHGSNGNGEAENTDEANPVDTKNLFDVSAEVYDKLPYEHSSNPDMVKKALKELGYSDDDKTVKMVVDTIEGVKNENLNESKSRFGGLDHSDAPLPMFESFQGARGQKPSKKVFENAAKEMQRDLKIMDGLDKPLNKLVDAAARAFKDIKDSELSDYADNFWTALIDLRHELGDKYNEFVDKVNAEMAKA